MIDFYHRSMSNGKSLLSNDKSLLWSISFVIRVDIFVNILVYLK